MLRQVQPRGLLIIGIIILTVCFCSAKDDEKALRELVERAAQLAEQHDIGEIMDLTTEDFKAQPGDLDHRETKRILFMAFRHYGDLKVVHPRPSVDLDSGEGGASVSVPFLIVKRDQSLPELKGLYSDPKKWVEKVGIGVNTLQAQSVEAVITSYTGIEEAHLAPDGRWLFIPDVPVELNTPKSVTITIRMIPKVSEVEYKPFVQVTLQRPQ